MKKMIFVISIIITGIIACGEDPNIEEEFIDEEQEEQIDSLAGLDCPNVDMVPLEGKVIQLPYATFIKCGDDAYPKGFKDIGGNLTDLGEISGGFKEFTNCNPGTYDGTPVFFADYIGEFVASNKDTVFYKGKFTFDPTTQGEGIKISPSVIIGGTGRWSGAEGCFWYYDKTRLENGTFQSRIKGLITPPGTN